MQLGKRLRASAPPWDCVRCVLAANEPFRHPPGSDNLQQFTQLVSQVESKVSSIASRLDSVGLIDSSTASGGGASLMGLLDALFKKVDQLGARFDAMDIGSAPRASTAALVQGNAAAAAAASGVVQERTAAVGSASTLATPPSSHAQGAPLSLQAHANALPLQLLVAAPLPLSVASTASAATATTSTATGPALAARIGSGSWSLPHPPDLRGRLSVNTADSLSSIYVKLVIGKVDPLQPHLYNIKGEQQAARHYGASSVGAGRMSGGTGTTLVASVPPPSMAVEDVIAAGGKGAAALPPVAAVQGGGGSSVAGSWFSTIFFV